MTVYGVEMEDVEELAKENPLFEGFLSENLGIKKVQVIWAVRHELARTVEDILARRTRALFLDAHESIAIARETAELMAMELDYNPEWIENQVKVFTELANGYTLEGLRGSAAK